MNCYRVGCKCDDIKKTYCIYKLSENQQKLIAKINKDGCIICGDKTVASKYQKIDTRLCTSCGTVAIDDVVVRSCLINSRRVS
ncbi:MAG: hypothetical protein GX053_12745 [Tissierella sp.]|nr:hypothetical protein [Tissierella sp.]